MSVDIQAEPVVEPFTFDDDDLNHIVCCNPDLALCGADASDAEWGDIDVEEPDDCVVCRDLEGGSCGAPFCWLRNRWRWSRWGKWGRRREPSPEVKR